MGAGTVARAFHEATKHSPTSVRRDRHALDWGNRPYPFKIFDGLEHVPLPTDLPRLRVAAVDAIGSVNAADPAPGPDLRGLARLLTYGAGVLRKKEFADGEVYFFRTYASAGALYPVEVYVVCGDLSGLVAGVYHFDPLGRVLVPLRVGDYRPYLVRAAASEPAVARAPILLVLTGIPWRTTWKYTARGYRHLFWDAGMILANTLGLAMSAGLAARVVLGFADGEVEALLGLDGVREFPLCLVAVGAGAAVAAATSSPEPAAFTVRPLSPREVSYPQIREVNDAGRLSIDHVALWRSSHMHGRKEPVGVWSAAEASDPLEAVIRRRGSARRFGPRQMPAAVLRGILVHATRGVQTDYAPGGSWLVTPHLIANAVSGLPSGAYAWRGGDFQLLRAGAFRQKAGYLCLEQRLGADAAVTMFLMTALTRIVETFGDRGYRAAQLEGGILAGKVYLAAYAYRFGATGLTFYDDEVTSFFSPEAADESCMLVVAVGDSVRRLLPLA